MTNAARRGKPDAGNPHVRFDEGEVAPCTAEASLRRVYCRRQPEGRTSVCAATSRRGSLLYKRVLTVTAMMAVAMVFADPATGWKQTGAGPYDYNDAANWVNGEINGVFGSDLTLAANQTITFAADTPLADGLSIAYKGEFSLTFQSDGSGAKTLTLGGNITSAPSAYNKVKAYVTFGSDTAANSLELDLGGARRTFTIGNVWHQRGAIKNGAFSLEGGAGANGFFYCYSAENAFAGPVTVHGDTTFCYLGFQTAGALPDGVTILLTGRGCIQGVQSAGYACGTLLANGRIDPASTGGVAFTSNENVDIDLTDYPGLFLAAPGTSATYNGHITPANGRYRICSPSHIYLGAANALTGKADVLVDCPSPGVSLYLDKRNDVEGNFTVVNCGLVLRTNDGALPNARIHMHGGTLHLNPANASSTRRAEHVHFHGASLSLNSNGNNATQEIIGELVLDVRDPSYGVIGGINQINLTANGKTANLHVEQFTRTNNAIWRLCGKESNNRILVGGADGENTVQFTVGNNADILGQLVGGGGAAGTTTVSIYPYAIAHLATGGYHAYDTLVTYGVNGFRALDYETEFVSSITPGTISRANVRLPVGSTTEITSDTTVNAVFMQGSDLDKGNTSLTGSGTLTVSSGVFVMGYHRYKAPYVQCAAVNFGDKQGVINYSKGKISYWETGLNGSSGAIFFQCDILSEDDSKGNGVTISGENASNSTLTGDVVIHGKVINNAANALPGGPDRHGNLYVNAYANLLTSGFNGVYGIGNLYRQNDAIVVGADGADGDFAGDFTGVNNVHKATQIVKVGDGRQRLGGTNYHTGTTTVNAGVLQVDGALTASSVTVADGATLAGVGSFGSSVTLADGSALEIGSIQIGYDDDHSMDISAPLTFQGDATLTAKAYGNTELPYLDVQGAVSGSGTVTVVIDGALKAGRYLLVKSSSALSGLTFARGAGCGSLTLENDAHELYMAVNSGLSVFVR